MTNRWLWWQLWLSLKPKLKAGNFAVFKQELAAKMDHAQKHLDDVIKQREKAEKANQELTKEIEELRVKKISINFKKIEILRLSKLECL